MGVDEGLDVGVVLGDLLEQALAQQVDAGVADIEGDPGRPLGEGGQDDPGDRGPGLVQGVGGDGGDGGGRYSSLVTYAF